MTDDPGPESPDAPQEREWLRQNSLVYGALIAIGVVLVQPFLTAGSLDATALTCVLAFAVAIPLLGVAALAVHTAVYRRIERVDRPSE